MADDPIVELALRGAYLGDLAFQRAFLDVPYRRFIKIALAVMRDPRVWQYGMDTYENGMVKGMAIIVKHKKTKQKRCIHLVRQSKSS